MVQTLADGTTVTMVVAGLADTKVVGICVCPLVLSDCRVSTACLSGGWARTAVVVVVVVTAAWGAAAEVVVAGATTTVCAGVC